MKSKAILVVLALVIIGVGGYYFYDRNQRQAQAPSTEPVPAETQQSQTLRNNSNNPPPPATPSSTQPAGNQNLPTKTFSNGEEAETQVDVLVKQIDYNGSAFVPNSVNIKVGDIIIFKNNGQNSFWPASNPHPVHTDYSEFDAKSPVAAGGKYQFKFTKAGAWGFHDHLNPGARGVVNVSQ